VFEVELNPANYSYVPGSFKQYPIAFSGSGSFVSGLDYAAPSNRLYASTRDGIYSIANRSSWPVPIPGSTSWTKQPLSSVSGSQLQYVKSIGKIVGVGVSNTSANTGKLFSIDSGNNIVAIPSAALKSMAYGPGPAPLGFTLPDLIPAADRCPLAGSWFDSANCFVARPPAGTSPFVYNGGLYYTPLPGNQCPLPGSSFDSANCFVVRPPAGTNPFIYAGNLYYTPLC
jgi:hypothetical protein